MTTARRTIVTLMATIVAATSLKVAAPVVATPNDVALNGTFVAVSDGQFAKTREAFDKRPDVTSVWTLSSSCTTFQDCTGTLVSDQGWTAELVYASQRWRAWHVIPDWLRCPDGTAVDGKQTFTFWVRRFDAPERFDRLIGQDETVAPSGACGVNKWMTVRMPLTVTRR
ncbi:hypothetical protein L2K20_14535 [Mycobacterium sp. MBM]|nr:hypothetical protein [Mycobacterium sp. MBM]